MKNILRSLTLLSIVFLAIIPIGLELTPIKANVESAAALQNLLIEQTTQWQTNDTILLSAGKIDWTEEWFNAQPSGAQAVGWIEFHQREHYGRNDIFLDLSEKFDWKKLGSSSLWKDSGFNTQFTSWESFVQNLTESPSWWLEWSWGLNTRWYDISKNSTVIQAAKEGDIATITIWCHVNRIQEYLIGHAFEKAIFDLYSVDMGKAEIYEYYYDSTSNGQSVYLHFSAPSTILRQEGDSFTATIDISPLRRNTASEHERNIFIIMPSQSEVESITPSNLGQYKKNTATFTISASGRLPSSFTVISGPHVSSLTETIIDTFTSPSQIIVMASVVTIAISGFSGVGMLRKRRTHNRTAKLIAAVYRDYRKDHEKFDQELDRIHDLLYRLVAEDKISDDQFDKLLDILEKTHKQEFGEKD